MTARRAVFLLVLLLPPVVVHLQRPVPRLDSDAVEYYAHLRSLVYDHDVDFSNEFAHFGILSRWDKDQRTVTGLRRTNFSVGPALLWMPGYLLADGIARATGGAEDGYSALHIRAVCLSSLLLGLAGLLLLRRTLSGLVPGTVADLAVLATLHGTFLWWYLVEDAAVSHAPSFFAGACLLWCWWPVRDRIDVRRAAGLGALCGLCALVRWQSAVLLLVPALSLLATRDEAGRLLVATARGLRALAARGGALGAAFVLALLPQLLVFKAIFGTYLLPYPVQGRDYLDLGRPKLLLTFFSSRHGLLYWSPLLWLGFLGLVPLARRHPRAVLCLVPPLVVTAYVNACAGDWWGGGGFGNRRFDAVLPILALGLAAAFEGVRRFAAARPLALPAAAAAVLVGWNFVFMEICRLELVPRDGTVSFPSVAETGAALVSETVGSPLGWPASWIFAARYGQPAARWDRLAGLYLFHRQNNLGGLIEVGGRAGDRSDEPLLGDGWGVRTACGGALCRALLGEGQLFAPLFRPETLDFVVRASGSGPLQLDVNDRPEGTWTLRPELADFTVRVPARALREELNVLTLHGVGRVLVDHVQVRRVAS